MKRVIIIVLDSLGIGALPDAGLYGDEGSHTLCSVAAGVEELHIPHLVRMGLGCIDGVMCVPCTEHPSASFARLYEASKGKDTITGHWEIAGLWTEEPFQTYPDGFPDAFIAAYEKAIGRQVLGNYVASGTEIIEELGDEHEATGKPIVYTSADSVFQVAANTQVIELEQLYRMCETAREMLVGPWACGRVIARPYIKTEEGKRIRTSDRKDYAISPPQPTMLDVISENGQEVVGIGKISNIFNGSGITRSYPIKNNDHGMQETLRLMRETFAGLIFINLVDFDSLYGHRRDAAGYAGALEAFDRKLAELLDVLREQDVLMLCADHGNDPGHPGWDHTREAVPLLVYGQNIAQGVNLGTRQSFSDIAATVLKYLGLPRCEVRGTSFLEEIQRYENG